MEPLSTVMFGATGAVGSHTAHALASFPETRKLTLLGRRPLEDISGGAVKQHEIDVFDPTSYRRYLAGHETAICTLGVGEPSKVPKEQFVKIDKTAVLDFATACKEAGVRHFQLLGSVGSTSHSKSFYLRTKGELEDGLRSLGFRRLSIFRPSMILTPTNRYGFSQAVTLLVWPLLTPLLAGPLRKTRGIPVDRLGRAIAANALTKSTGEEVLFWDDFISLTQPTDRDT